MACGRMPSPTAHRLKQSMTRLRALPRLRPCWSGHLALTTQVDSGETSMQAGQCYNEAVRAWWGN